MGNNRKILGAIFLLALLARLFSASAIGGLNRSPHNVILGQSDSIKYADLAENILYHKTLSFNGKNPTAWSLPGYPVFLALFYLLFGSRYIFAKIAQCILGALTCVMIYLIAKKVTGKKEALLSGAISIFYPFLIFWNALFLTVTLFTFLLACFVYYFLKMEEKPSLKNISVCGVLIGLATLTRAPTIIFPLFLLWWAVMNLRRYSWKSFGIVSGLIFFMFVTMSPWFIRNYLVFREFIPTTTQGGVIFCAAHNKFTANDSEYIGGIYSWSNRKRLYENFEYVNLTELEKNSIGYQLGFDFLKKNHKVIPKLLYRKSLRFWGIFVDSKKPTSQRLQSSITIYSLSYGLLVPFAIIGFFLSLRKRRKFFIIYLVILMGYIGILFLFGLKRFRAPLEPYLIIFAAIGIFGIYDSMKGYISRWSQRNR